MAANDPIHLFTDLTIKGKLTFTNELDQPIALTYDLFKNLLLPKVTINTAQNISGLKIFKNYVKCTMALDTNLDDDTLVTANWVNQQVSEIVSGGGGVSISTAQTITGEKTFSIIPKYSGASLGLTTNDGSLATTQFVKSQNYLIKPIDVNFGDLFYQGINGLTSTLPLGPEGSVLTVEWDMLLDRRKLKWSINVQNANYINIIENNNNALYCIPFTDVTSGNNQLCIDNSTTPLTYNPSTSTLTATTFAGNATSASSISQGIAGNLLYQSGANTTSALLNPSQTNGSSFLTFFNGLPVWTDLLTINRMTEIITPLFGSSPYHLIYSNSAIFSLTAPSADFTVNITNLPANTSRVLTITLIIDASTNKKYATTVQIESINQTVLYNGGSSSVSVSQAILIIQQLSIIYVPGLSVPTIISSISSIF